MISTSSRGPALLHGPAQQAAASITDRNVHGGSSMRQSTMGNYSACNMTLLNDEMPNGDDFESVNGVRPPVIGTVPES
mgnify:CR=1 FL=1